MNSKKYMEKTEQYVLHTYNRFPVVLEKGDAGAALASTAVTIIKAYFDREDTASILPENQLIP